MLPLVIIAAVGLLAGCGVATRRPEEDDETGTTPDTGDTTTTPPAVDLDSYDVDTDGYLNDAFFEENTDWQDLIQGTAYAGQTPATCDCDDEDETIHPDASEQPYDDIDQNCDGADVTDVDGDGFDAMEVGGEDCDDSNASVNPDALEVLDNSADENCDGTAEQSPNYCDGFVGIEFDSNPTIINLENEGDASQGLQITTGDFDGDGTKDLAFGAPNYNSLSGRAYAYQGGAASIFATPGTSVSADTADFKMTGTPFTVAGGPIAAYDINGDGQDELFTSTNGYVAGIYDPFTTGNIETSEIDFSAQTVPSAYDMIFIGGLELQYVLNLGDINGNGLDSIMVTNAENQCVTMELDNTAGFVDGSDLIQHTLSAAYGDDDLCFPTSTVGADLDGDGINEVITGSSSGDLNENAGHVQVIRGGTIPENYTLPQIAEGCGDADCVTLTGAEAGNNTGSYLNAGDLNGDGYPDLLVGGAEEDNGHENSGANHFVSGINFDGAWEFGGFLQSGDDITLAYDEIYNDTSVANMSDMDESRSLFGDDTDAKLTNGGMVSFRHPDCDVAVLATSAATYAGSTDGRIYVTSSSRVTGSADHEIIVTEGDDQMLEGAEGSLLGFRITMADLTGDGIPELIATAPEYDNDRGQIRIYKGSEVRE